MESTEARLLRVRLLGQWDYETSWEAMKQFTGSRDAATADELWLLEHGPVYTLGMNGDRAHLLQDTDIPVVATDRGGQITYHGPGQLIAYVLLDIRRRNLGVRALVAALEDAVIDLLGQYGIGAKGRRDAPGVYVGGSKIASLGLRVRHGCSYHGLSINVDLDLAPFAFINPCGYAGMQVTSLHALGVGARTCDLFAPLSMAVSRRLGYPNIEAGLREYPAGSLTL